MRIAMLATNMIRIDREAGKGTELFVHFFVQSLIDKIHHDNLPYEITAFASGNSDLPIKIESVAQLSSLEDPAIGVDRHKLYELALLSKAFELQDQYDAYHVHISNGEYVLPFIPFIDKPVIFTMHGDTSDKNFRTYFDLFSHHNNIHFVAISDHQRSQMPDLPYVATIRHGINISEFEFCEAGGDTVMWAGRGIPDKGLDTVLTVAEQTGRSTAVFPILKSEHLAWLKTDILSRRRTIRQHSSLIMDFDVTRNDLAKRYAEAKLFLFPIQWEEPFGLVMVESMAAGTPVVAFSRGSVPEIIEDGVTGFLVNPSEEDHRGSYITQKSGLEGLLEAVEHIYDMPSDTYRTMRKACRARVEKEFSADRMVGDYLRVYDMYDPKSG